MKQTAYEFTKGNLSRGWKEAERIDKEVGAVRALKRYTAEMFAAADMRGVAKMNEDLVAPMPFVLAARVCRELKAAGKDPFDWESFALHPSIMDFRTLEADIGGVAFRPDQAQDWASASILNLWHYSIHELGGQKVYELSHGLGTKLLNTDVRGLSTDDLRLPFRNIYIVVPDEMGLSLGNEVTGQHKLGGVYVTEISHQGERLWKMLFWGPPNERSGNNYDDALFHFTVRLPEGLDLEAALDREQQDRHAVAATPWSEAYYLKFWRPLFKLVMNTVVYVTWPDAELRQVENPNYARVMERVQKHPKGSHKRERAAQELRETLQQRRILLGPTVKPLEASAPGTHHAPTVRTLVTGHWKRQFYGEARALRKWIFIEPFWRGPDAAPESNPRRVVGTEATRAGPPAKGETRSPAPESRPIPGSTPNDSSPPSSEQLAGTPTQEKEQR